MTPVTKCLATKTPHSDSVWGHQGMPKAQNVFSEGSQLGDHEHNLRQNMEAKMCALKYKTQSPNTPNPQK
jgi:hypothetical protein